MQGLNGITFHGLMTSTALVVSNGAPTAVKVAARLAKVVFGDRIQICDGVDDQVEIQAALDALPATGGEVLLLEGTYYIESSLVLDSYQTLRGCGRNTILTTTTIHTDIITATGSDGNEKVGILITDLCIDGTAGGTISDVGILWTYVDYSQIRSIWSQFNYELNIKLDHSDFNSIIGNSIYGPGDVGIYVRESCYNTITGNVCQEIGCGIYLHYYSKNNTVSGNVCQGNSSYGIYVYSHSENNTLSGNLCQGNGKVGIFTEGSSNNTISANICQGNGEDGIFVWGISTNSIIIGNICLENSQTTDIAKDNIRLFSTDYNLIASNICRQGGETNKPRYGINISDDVCNKNIVQGNDLHDAGKTANFNDAGTLTIVQDDNREIEITQVRHYAYMKNTSGGDLATGDVVVLKAVAAGDEVTTTTIEGDQRVFGMVAEAIANNAYGYVQVKGKTTALKVNGTTDIAIGDLIGTYTEAKIGMKAAAGKMAFAIALEAYTANDSNGVIDALLITPRQAI